MAGMWIPVSLNLSPKTENTSNYVKKWMSIMYIYLLQRIAFHLEINTVLSLYSLVMVENSLTNVVAYRCNCFWGKISKQVLSGHWLGLDIKGHSTSKDEQKQNYPPISIM